MRSEASTRPGTILTVLVGSWRFFSSLNTLEAGAVLLLGMWKSLVDFMPVGMKGLPTRPALEVAPVSLMADGMVPSSTPHLTCAFVIGLARRVRFLLDFYGVYSWIGSGDYGARQCCLFRCGVWLVEKIHCLLAYLLCY